MSDRTVMKVAIPHWQGRVSPVFDAATRLLVIEVTDGHECGQVEVPLSESDPVQRAKELARSETGVLICGAISWPLEMAVSSGGIEVIAQVCGQVEEVLSAFLEGRLTDPAFLMLGKLQSPTAVEWTNTGLPAELKVLLAPKLDAFLNVGDQAVCHGGIALEEVIVPFVEITRADER